MKLSKTYAKINASTLGDYFIAQSNNLLELELPFVVRLGNFSLFDCEVLKVINVPLVEYAGHGTLCFNKFLTNINWKVSVVLRPNILFFNPYLNYEKY